MVMVMVMVMVIVKGKADASTDTVMDYLYSHLDSARESQKIPGGFGGQSPPHQSSRYVERSSSSSSKKFRLVAFQPTRSQNSKLTHFQCNLEVNLFLLALK